MLHEEDTHKEGMEESSAWLTKSDMEVIWSLEAEQTNRNFSGLMSKLTPRVQCKLFALNDDILCWHSWWLSVMLPDCGPTTEKHNVRAPFSSSNGSPLHVDFTS